MGHHWAGFKLDELIARAPVPKHRCQVQRRWRNGRITMVPIKRHTNSEAQRGILALWDSPAQNHICCCRAIRARAGCVFKIQERDVFNLPSPSCASVMGTVVPSAVTIAGADTNSDNPELGWGRIRCPSPHTLHRTRTAARPTGGKINSTGMSAKARDGAHSAAAQKAICFMGPYMNTLRGNPQL